VTSRGPGRALAGIGLVCATVLALASSVVLHGAAVVVVLFAAGVAACVGYIVQDQGRAAGVEWAWKAAAATVAVIVLVTGVVVLAGGTVAALVSGLVVTGGALWVLKTRRTRRAGAEKDSADPVMDGGDPASVLGASWASVWQPPVSLLGTSDLGSEWLRTTSALASPVESAKRQQIIERRQETLDELERRDPAGFARWLAAGAAGDSDPATFVRQDRTTGRDAA
jgi:hypothetical protein